jgi:DNA-binding Lrp family transcriptional regulator
VLIPEDKYCTKCNDTKLAADFYKNICKKDGLSEMCKVCTLTYRKDRDRRLTIKMKRKPKGKNVIQSADFENQPDRIKAIVFALVEDPKITVLELAEKVGLEPDSVRKHMHKNQFLRALRGFGAEKVTRMLPKALYALDKSLEANSEDVRLKAAKEVLQNEKVLGPERIDVTVNDLASKTNAELEAMLAAIKLAPQNTIEAEIIS